MVEVAISLAIIGIISGVAVSMSVSSVNIETRAVTTSYVEGYAESVIECFYFSTNDDEFEAALKKIDANCQRVNNISTLGGPEYALSGMGFTLAIETNISAGAISLTATDSKGSTLLSFEHNPNGEEN